ncbi:transporter substrate-binding domain-containing protein [Sphaerisporangium album]|uniref:transporter substrate-binding domain-containing protein n=1 Tax=Sphaerisporangium album TaxID=509200 RepID=UPI0015F0F4B2|nr:transporter substrate-binding domain-containing protein [Sphaerisporangium album]
MPALRWVLLAGLFATPTVLAGCGGGHGSLVIGVRPGRPGLADVSPSGGYAGFEIEVAGYVARRLGYRDDQVRYVTAPGSPPADLAMGEPLPVDAPGPPSVAGPYLVSGQDILAGAGDMTVRRLRDLTQKRVCTASPAPLVARFGAAWQRAFLTVSTAEDCARRLASGRVHAVTGDAAVLAGLAARSPEAVRLVGRTFSREGYGIAVARDDLRAGVDDALRAMFDDGAWRRAVIRHLGSLAAKYPVPPALRTYPGPRSAP